MEIENVLHPRKNISSRIRTPTDVYTSFFIVYTLFVSLWMVIAIYAFSTCDGSQLFFSKNMDKGLELFDNMRILAFTGYLILAGLYTVLLFMIMEWLPNFIYITLTVFWIPSAISFALFYIHKNWFALFGLISSTCSSVLFIYLVYSEWMSLPEKVFKQSCKLIRSSRPAFLFSILCSFVSILLIAFGVIIHLCLDTIKETNNVTLPTHVIFFMIINLIACLMLFRAIFYFGMMVLSGTFLVLYYTKNETEESTNAFTRCFKYTIRYHICTILYGTSMSGSGKIQRMMISSVITKLRSDSINTLLILFVVCNVFDPVVLIFTTSTAMLLCVIDGNNFIQSTKDSYGYFAKYPKQCLLIVKIFQNLVVGIIIIISISMLLSLSYYLNIILPINEENHMNIEFLMGIAFVSSIFVLDLIMLLDAAIYATFLVSHDGANSSGEIEKSDKL